MFLAARWRLSCPRVLHLPHSRAAGAVRQPQSYREAPTTNTARKRESPSPSPPPHMDDETVMTTAARLPIDSCAFCRILQAGCLRRRDARHLQTNVDHFDCVGATRGGAVCTALRWRVADLVFQRDRVGGAVAAAVSTTAVPPMPPPRRRLGERFHGAMDSCETAGITYGMRDGGLNSGRRRLRPRLPNRVCGPRLRTPV